MLNSVAMRVWLAVAAALVGSCFAPDLGDGQVVCGAGGACPSGYVCRTDDRCWRTGSDGSSDGGGGDLASGCARSCPPGSSCSGGLCQPPTGAQMCKRAGDCSGGNVCAPFVVGGMVKFLCASPLPGANASRCGAPGADTTCKSGYCVVDGNDATLHVCLVPCMNANDCGGSNCDPAQPPVVIEGVTAPMFKICAVP